MKDKLCFEHGKDLKGKNQKEINDKWELVNPDNCSLCKLELKLNQVLDLPQFRDLKP